MLIFYNVGTVAGSSTAADEGAGPSIAAEAIEASSDVDPAAEPSTDKDALIKALYFEINALRKEKWDLQRRVPLVDLTESVLLDKRKFLLHTGVNSVEIFQWIVSLIKDDVPDRFLTIDTQLLIVLMKFRLNLSASYIAGRFNVSKNTVRRVFDSLISILAGKLKSLIKWPSKKSLKKNCPQMFKNSDFS